MKKITFCDHWLFGEVGQALSPVTLPHDAMQWHGRAADAPSGSGSAYFKGGSYVYEKRFIAPVEWRDMDISVEFEGAYPMSEVYLNGDKLGGCAYGYGLFRIDLTNLNYGEENVLTVYVNNSETPNSRWYSGAGLYRPVWLLEQPKRHILADGLRVTTLSHDPARVRVTLDSNVPGVRAVIEALDGDVVVAGAEGDDVPLDIPDAKLWSAEHPHLYTCRARLVDEGGIIDEQEVRFGIRTLSWSAREGLKVNGETVLLKGGCVHHDNGILGSRSYAEAEYRKVRRLKSFGFNAIRSAHNPAVPALLDACDELGMYVMDEGWDMWYKQKTTYDYSHRFEANYLEDMRSMVAKDYNHPSVILYSIGNEVTEPAEERGVALAKALVDQFHALDASRPVTAGINLMLILMARNGVDLFAQMGEKIDSEGPSSTEFNMMAADMGQQMVMAAASDDADAATSPVLDLLDIAGYNYAQSRYPLEGEKHPDRVVVGSETFPYDLAGNWRMVEQYPFLVGDFMWTAWDYLGEVGLGAFSDSPDAKEFQKPYPWLLADSGAFDILGNDNAEAGLARAVWCPEAAPYIAVLPLTQDRAQLSKGMWRKSNGLPSWSWRGCEGREAIVEVYSGAPCVELFLNGESLGKAATEDCKATFETVYAPGTLTAVALDEQGVERSRSALRTAEGDIRPVITPEEGDGSLVWLDISLRGDNGAVESAADAELSVSVTGGDLLAFGSANPRTAEDFQSGRYTTYYGRAQAVVRRHGGPVTVAVTGKAGEATATL